MTIPRAPAGAGPVGRQLWRDVLTQFEMDGHEQLVLRQAVRAADRCELLAETLANDGVTVLTRHGEPKLNPVASELRSAELGLCRLLICLRIPLGDRGDDDGGQHQHRGMRGVYGLGEAS
jgi:hypothetical protein